MNSNFEDEMDMEYEMVPTKVCMPMGIPNLMIPIMPRILKEIDNIECLKFQEGNRFKEENSIFEKIKRDDFNIFSDMEMYKIPYSTVSLMYKNIINSSLMNYIK